MRRVDYALPWGRELEFGEDPINDRRLEFMRDQLHARISRAQPTFRVKTPKSFGMPHLQFNAKKRQMELDQAEHMLQARQKMVDNARLYRERVERKAKPQGFLLRPAKTSLQLNREKFKHRLRQENQRMHQRLDNMTAVLPVRKWAQDAARQEQLAQTRSRFNRVRRLHERQHKKNKKSKNSVHRRQGVKLPNIMR